MPTFILLLSYIMTQAISTMIRYKIIMPVITIMISYELWLRIIAQA